MLEQSPREGDNNSQSQTKHSCLFPTNAPTLATAKQEPEMSRPLWGKGDRASGGRGELASNLDCFTTNAPTPTTAVQINRTKRVRPYKSASELPLSDTLTGATSPQRARL